MKHLCELQSAIASGDQAKVGVLLRDETDLEERNRADWTPLMAASLKGQVDIARLLLDHGADLHAVNFEGKSAIHMAAMRGGPDIVRLLVRLGADVNAADKFGGYTPLHLAAAHSNRKLTVETCDVLLAAGAEIDSRANCGITPLFSAAISNRSELVDFLLAHGAELDSRDNSGRTIFIFVVRMGLFDEMAERLIRYGANINAPDDEGRTALMYAALDPHRRMIGILLDAGANPNLSDAAGKTALMYAAGEAPLGTLISMLGREASTRNIGANTDKWDPEKKAARLAKAYEHRAEVIRHLIARGADSSLQDAEGNTALDIALVNYRCTDGDNAEVVKVLRCVAG